MRRVALLAAVVAASLVLAAPGAAAARTPAGFFGVMVNGVLDAPSVNLAAEGATMHRDGVGSERFEIAWDLVEPRPGMGTEQKQREELREEGCRAEHEGLGPARQQRLAGECGGEQSRRGSEQQHAPAAQRQPDQQRQAK